MRGAGPSVKAGTGRSLSSVRSLVKTGDQTPHPPTERLGLSQVVVRGLGCVQFCFCFVFFTRATNRLKVVVGNRRVTKGWMFPRLCQMRGSHTWPRLVGIYRMKNLDARDVKLQGKGVCSHSTRLLFREMESHQQIGI